MRRLAFTLFRTLEWSLVSLLIIFAISISLARELLQDVDIFRADIEQYASEKSGLHIRLGKVHGLWRGMRPSLVVLELDVKKQIESPSLFTAKKITLQWRILSSIANLEPRFKLLVDEATLELVYHDGFLLPAGIDPPANDAGGKTTDSAATLRLVDYISRQPHLELSNSQLSIDGLWSEKARFDDVNVSMTSQAGLKQFEAGFNLKGLSDSKVELRGRSQGTLTNLNTLQGQFYVKIDNASVVPWLPAAVKKFENLEFESGYGAVELWASVKQGVVHQATANVALENIVISNTKQKSDSTLQAAKGVVQYRHLADGKAQIVLSDFHMKNKQFVWEPKLLSLNIEHVSSNQWGFDLLLDEINMTPWINYYVGLTDAASPAHKMLIETLPKGELKNLHIDVLLNNGVLENFHVTGALEGGEIRPHGFVPGLDNISAVFDISETDSFISLESDGFILDYPALFRGALPFDWLDAQLHITKSEDGVSVKSGLIGLNNEEVRTATQFSMQFPLDKVLSPRIQLQSTLRDLDASLTPFYLPAGILPEGLVDFLDRSIQKGQLLRGDIVFNGPMQSKKQEENLNMQLGFVVDDVEYQFLPDWKSVENAQVDVIVDRTFVDVYIVGGGYYGALIDQATVTTRRDDKNDPFRLTVNALVIGEARQGLDVLQYSPLRPRVGGFVDAIDLSGDMRLDLELSLLLAKKDIDTQVDLSVGIQRGSFAMPTQKILVNNVVGELTFDLKNGLRANSVLGSVFGGEVKATIFPVFGSKENELLSTNIGMSGNASLSNLSDWLTIPIMKRLSGDLPYDATLILPKDKAKQPTLNLQSSLLGVKVSLPEPFNKAAADEGELVLSTTLGGDVRVFSLRYDDLIDMTSEIDSNRLAKVGIVFGGGRAALPEKMGYKIEGSLTTLDIKAWANTLKSASEADRSGDRSGNSAEEPSFTEADHPPMLIEETLLDGGVLIDEVYVFGQYYPQTQLTFLPAVNAWNIQVKGVGIDGEFVLPKYLLSANRELHAQLTPIVASFSQLNISRSKDQGPQPEPEMKSQQTKQLSAIDPSLLPPLELAVDRLMLGDEAFGRWSMTLSPVSDGMLIEPLAFHLKATDFSGKGRWQINHDGMVTSFVQGDAKAKNVADVISGWGIEPSLDSESASASLAANWPGAPFEFDLLSADATVSLNIEEGHFLNVDSGAVDKVWGALNFQTLLKRLQLNFSDLSSSDLTFEDIKGDLTLHNKILTINKMKVDSPAVDISLNGDLLLAKKQLNLSLDVAVPVARNLVLPAAAVGGLPAAATAYVIEKILGDQLNKLTTIKYEVKGTFDAPEVRVKESFNVIPKALQNSILKTEGVVSPKDVQPVVEERPLVDDELVELEDE